MPAPKGNKFWLLRSSHGVKPIFETEEQLWGAACEYFQYAQDNPLHEERALVAGGVVEVIQLEKMRAMTLNALLIFLDISHDTWRNYRKKEGFIGVTSKVDLILRTQKFEGAAAGLLNANIIARDLGLQDHTSNEQYGPDKGPIENKWVVEVVEVKKS